MRPGDVFRRAPGEMVEPMLKEIMASGGNGLLSCNAVDRDGTPLLIVVARGSTAVDFEMWLRAETMRRRAAGDGCGENALPPWGVA